MGMRAVVCRRPGGPEVLEVAEVPRPAVPEDGVLVRVHASSVNPADFFTLSRVNHAARALAARRRRPPEVVGRDFAGTVEAVGKNVTLFKPGDEVFGGADGAVAEYVVVRESRGVALKPANVSFEQAAAVPVAAVTALQGLRDKGGIKPGQKVLINGASGGVGTFAVQIAKHFGAAVTGVTSTRNVELVRSLGADHVVDYTQEDFAQGPQRYDLILDNVGNRSISDLRRALQPKGTLVIVGGQKGDWLGPMMGVIKASIVANFVDQKMGFFIAKLDHDDMKLLGELMQTGKVTPVIDRRYPLSEAAKAMEYLETGRARGKVIVSLQ